MGKTTLPFPYIKSLPPADQARLKRDFDAVLAKSDTPFVVVASDGSGDYRLLQAAISAAGTTPTLIYVKSIADGATTIMQLTAGCDIAIFGMPDDNALSGSVDTSGVIIFGGITGGSNTSKFTILNMQVQQGTAGAFASGYKGRLKVVGSLLNANYIVDGSAVSATEFVASYSRLQNLGLLANGADVYVNATLTDCTITALFDSFNFGTTTFGPTNAAVVIAHRCIITADTNQTVVFGSQFFAGNQGNGFTFEMIGCTYSSSGAGSNLRTFWFFGNAGANHGGNTCVLDGNTFLSGGTWTFNSGNQGASGLTIRNNTSPGTTALLTTFPTYGGIGSIVIDGTLGIKAVVTDNYMPGTSFTFQNGSGHALSSLILSGTYKNVALDVDSAQVAVVLNSEVGSSPGFAGTLLVVSGDNNMIVAAMQGNTTATGYSFTAASSGNIAIITGLGTCTTSGTDAGTGNQINALAPSGAAGGALSGAYPAPLFAGRDSSVDQLNRDLLPTLLAGTLGVTTIPAPAPGSTPTGPAGGALTGTFPNPALVGRDSSVDKINQDMLPTLLAPQEGIIVYPTQPIPETAADLDLRRKDLIPALLAPAPGVQINGSPLGKPVSAVAPGSGQVLRFNSTTGLYTPSDLTGFAESDVVGLVTDLDQLRKTITPSAFVATGVRVLGGGVAGDRRPSVTVINTATQAIATATNTVLNIPVPVSDPWGLRTSATQLKVPTGYAGFWLVCVNLAWPAATDATRRLAAININGAGLLGSTGPALAVAGQGSNNCIAIPLLLAVGDLITVTARHDSATTPLTIGIGGFTVTATFLTPA